MKRAWEWDYEMFSTAKPIKKNEDELICWDDLLEGTFLKEAQQMLENGKGAWRKPLPESKAPYSKMLAAIVCMYNMGYDVVEAEKLIPEAFKAIEEERLIDLSIINSRVYKILNEAEKIDEHPYWKYKIYNSFEEYESAVEFLEYSDYKLPTREKLFDLVHAGWLAEIAGAALGTAVEGFKSDKIKEVYGNITEYVKQPETFNDDITFELALLEAFIEKGYKITSDDIADKWVALIPFAYTAEEVALRNIKAGIYPPQSGYLANPYREMIGAPMRAAICGALAPGNPKEAARLAWTDGCVSHHNNGIIAEIFNAILVSLAYVEKDVRVILDKTIHMIPKDCELYSVIEFAYNTCQKIGDYEKAWKVCEEHYKEYDWVHTYPNIAAEIISMYFAGNDFNKAMNMLVMAGQDMDCTAGPIGHVYGVLLGTGGIDKKWIEPLKDTLETYVRTMEKLSIKELSEKTTDAIIKYTTK